MKFKELIEGREYRIKKGNSFIYTKKNELLFCKSINDYSFIPAKAIAQFDFEELPWKPEAGEKCYLVDATGVIGYNHFVYFKGEWADRIISRIKVYRTEEEVIQAVKELGWDVE